MDEQGKPLTRSLGYNRLGRNSSQTVCDRYFKKSDPKTISYFRHHAFEAQFYKFENEWYLELTPTYYFTHDGFKIHTYYESKLKGKKGLDKAETVFSETLFWADILTRGNINNRDMFMRSLLEFEFLFSGTLEVGVDDEQWLEKEDEEKMKILKGQIGLFSHEY
jgi:hypothetical protein